MVSLQKQISGMSAFVTVLSLPHPQQVYIIKARLESEGIECFIKDELTIQTDPFLSNAIGGIKLQVKEEDVADAVKILDAEGYQKYRDDNTNPYQGLQDFADKIPFFKKVRFEIRLGVLVLMLIVVVYLLIYFLTLPGREKHLTDSLWSVDYITYNDKDYIPNSFGMHLGTFADEITFINSENIDLPGFNTYAINAKWEFINDSLIISHADTFKFVYDGRYSVDFAGQNLVLKSKTTTITCTRFALF